MVFLVVLLRVHLRMYLTINAKITMKCESKDNIVSILDFQLLLIMLGPFNDTSHWQRSRGLKGEESKLLCSEGRACRTTHATK